MVDEIDGGDEDDQAEYREQMLTNLQDRVDKSFGKAVGEIQRAAAAEGRLEVAKRVNELLEGGLARSPYMVRAVRTFLEDLIGKKGMVDVGAGGLAVDPGDGVELDIGGGGKKVVGEVDEPVVDIGDGKEGGADKPRVETEDPQAVGDAGNGGGQGSRQRMSGD